jgi:hypothetical protein
VSVALGRQLSGGYWWRFLGMADAMNTNTGQVYTGSIAIEAAKDRGEPVVAVSRRVASLMREALEARRRKARRKDRQAAASRRRNR